jgi:hypothetical protein
MPKDVGFFLIAVAVAVPFIARALSSIAARRKTSYGIEGENLRLQSHTVLIVGLLVTLLLLLAGGAVVAMGT